MSLTCPCGAVDSLTEDSCQALVCSVCGNVCQESAITSDITFEETATGGFTVAGQHLSDESRKLMALSRSTRAYHRKIHKMMDFVGGNLKMRQTTIESAKQLFERVIEVRFDNGRPLPLLIGAALYLQCRLDRLEYLVSDVAKALQLEYFALGSCFTKMHQALGITPPLQDPQQLVERFASKFDLGDKLGPVVTTSFELLSVMRQNWLFTGRKPDPLCAAAVLLASKIHKVPVSMADAEEKLGVARKTLMQRLKELQTGPAAQIEVDARGALLTAGAPRAALTLPPAAVVVPLLPPPLPSSFPSTRRERPRRVTPTPTPVPPTPTAAIRPPPPALRRMPTNESEPLSDDDACAAFMVGEEEGEARLAVWRAQQKEQEARAPARDGRPTAAEASASGGRASAASKRRRVVNTAAV